MANIFGTSGNDNLIGTDDDDVIEGGDGNDTIDGRLGADVIRADRGDDTVRFSSIRFSSSASATGLIDGGEGYDTIDLRGITGVTTGAVELGVFGAYVGSQKFRYENVERILLGSGSDYVDVGSGTNVPAGLEVRAGGGNDQITATGRVSVYGEEGDDDFFVSGFFDGSAAGGIVDGGSGYDTLKTNIGFTIDLATGVASSFGGSFRVANFETLFAAPYESGLTTFLGDEGANTFAVNPLFITNRGSVSFSGRGGDDSLSGGISDDSLDGGDGNDNLTGLAGNDAIVGGNGNDVLRGGLGNDLLNGGAGIDTASYSEAASGVIVNLTVSSAQITNEGADTLVGIENITGSAFGDILTGDVGANVIDGGASNDAIDGGAGDDTIFGGAGDDTIIGNLGSNTIDGGDGIDTGVLLEKYVDYTVTQTGTGSASIVHNGAIEIDRFNSVERFRFSDSVVLTLRGGGSDYFDLSGKTGALALATGAGNDSIFAGAALTSADRIDGNVGVDQVAIQGNYTGANQLTLETGTLNNVELLAMLAGGNYAVTSADATVAAGQIFTVFGGNLTSNDSLTFNGSAETDGSFLMFGGLGTDTLTGGAGNDAFYFGPGRFGSTDAVTGGAGVDQLGLDSFAGNLTLRADNANVEVLALLRGPSGTINTYGTIFVDDSWVAAGETKTITAVTNFQDQVGPVLSNLVIDGSREANGNLRILAGSGNDSLFGGVGNDTLYGGLGRDRISGGAGADTFVFNSASESNVGVGNAGASVLNYDTLFGFTQGQDTIQVNGQTYAAFSAGLNGRLDDATFNANLATAVSNLVGDAAATFTATSGNHAGETFLVINTDGVSGYQAGSDLVLQLASTIGLTPPSAAHQDEVSQAFDVDGTPAYMNDINYLHQVQVNDLTPAALIL